MYCAGVQGHTHNISFSADKPCLTLTIVKLDNEFPTKCHVAARADQETFMTGFQHIKV